jgi:hypothetical protein
VHSSSALVTSSNQEALADWAGAGQGVELATGQEALADWARAGQGVELGSNKEALTYWAGAGQGVELAGDRDGLLVLLDDGFGVSRLDRRWARDRWGVQPAGCGSVRRLSVSPRAEQPASNALRLRTKIAMILGIVGAPFTRWMADS